MKHYFKNLLYAGALFYVSLSFSLSCFAGGGFLEQKLIPDDPAERECFGSSVAGTDTYAVVGADGDEDNGLNAGAVYLLAYNGSTWAATDKFKANDGAEEDRFGGAVDASKNYFIVGAVGDDSSGAAYIFERKKSGWQQTAKLLPGDTPDLALFGNSVAITENYAVVGAKSVHDNGYFSGAAYLFKRNGSTWTEVMKIIPADGFERQFFGDAVALTDDLLVVGAPGDVYNDETSGAAYIYQRRGDAWRQKAKLTAKDGAIGDHFGTSVSVGGDYLAIGADGDDENAYRAGAVYIFKHHRWAWKQISKLAAAEPVHGESFGSSVEIKKDVLVIGAYASGEWGDGLGAAYIFQGENQNWHQTAKLIASDQQPYQGYGRSVSFAGNSIIIGASGDDWYLGAVYLYTPN